MKNKFNWGWGIFFSIVIFMGILTVIVINMMHREVDLVTDKYYDKEIKYQQQIDTERRTMQLNENLQINYSGGILSLTFPPDSVITGHLYFYRPANLHKDFKIPINLDKKFSQSINVSNLDKGLWKLQVSWSINKNNYYTEKTLMLN